MSAFPYDDPCDRPYGPGNPDYEGADAKPDADAMSLQDAALQGQRAGEMGFGGSMNPFQDFAPEHAVWERARLNAVALRLDVSVEMARKVC